MAARRRGRIKLRLRNKQTQVSNASRAYWDALCPEERSAEMKRRAAKRKKKK